MNKEEIEQIKNTLKNIENWIDSPIDDIDKNYGIWEFNYKEATLLLKYIKDLQHQLEEKQKAIDDIRNYCNGETKFNCFGDSLTEKALYINVKATKKDILEILERGKND